MSANNRANLIGKLHTALKKHYKVPPAQPARPLLEHVLYASLLQDAPAELADEGMAKCEQDFFDWNEVRVTTVTELAQVLSRLPEPEKAAQRLKSNLQAIFEEFYTFDLDHLKKENLGKAIGKFEKMPGMTPFVLSHTIQHGLGGHSIPVDYSAMVIMLSTGIASQSEAMAGKVPGLERAIPKSKGIEFANLLHQAGIALNKNHKDKKARTVLDAVVKGGSKAFDDWLASKKAAKKRVVKRKAEEKAAAEAAALEAAEAAKAAATKKKKAAAKPEPAKQASVAKTAKQASPSSAAKKKISKKSPPKAAAAKPAKPAKTTAKKVAKKVTKKKVTTKKAAPKKPSKKTVVKKKTAPASSAKKKSKKAPAKTKAAKKATKKPAAKSKKSNNRKLTKRKPR
ncbi:MAG: hypothetical protein MI861_23410 [Pirellulales bacterium]|nr:hypothetical protein [Pirellulales bacterium]